MFKSVCLCTACSAKAKFDSFTCRSSGLCIPKVYYCDGTKHCDDGSDEVEENCAGQ